MSSITRLPSKTSSAPAAGATDTSTPIGGEKKSVPTSVQTESFERNSSGATKTLPATNPSPSEPTHTYKRFSGQAFVKGANEANAVDPNDVRQGALGDCWFLAAVIATAKTNPKLIENAIRPLGNGTYEVTLYKRDEKTQKKEQVKVQVTAEFPSVAGKPAYAKLGDGGKELWPLLIEKAAAQLAGYGTYNGIWAGHGRDGLDILSPHQGQGFEVKMSDVGTNPVGRMIDVPRDPTRVLKHLVGAMSIGQPLVCGSARYEYCDGQRIYRQHVYAITGVDLEKRTVTVQDPYGETNATVSIEEFQKTFGYAWAGAPIKPTGS